MEAIVMAREPLFTADLAKKCIGQKLYRPSNGEEGELFKERWCYECAVWNTLEDADITCPILNATMWNGEDDPRYPPQWTFDKNGQPCCTEFILVTIREHKGAP
jgi:hypothetical protein